MDIEIKMRDGTVREFKHEGRLDDSDYTKLIRYEGAFTIITDEWGNETAIPALDIVEVKTTLRGGCFRPSSY